MSANQEIISFPFPAYLAKYLFVRIKKQSIENNFGIHKPLDIDLRSVHGVIIRMLLEKADYPNIDKVEKGFRLFVTIPKSSAEYNQFVADARSSQLVMPPKAVKFLQDFYEEEFRAHYHNFVSGYVHGNNGKRYSIRQATEFFIETYQLQNLISYDSLVKFYHRVYSPLKKTIYAKKNEDPSYLVEKAERKTLINRLVKNKKE